MTPFRARKPDARAGGAYRADMADLSPISPAADKVVLSYDPPSRGPLRAVLSAIARHVVTAFGTVLVAHGWLDHDTAASAIGPAAEELVGVLLVAAASAGAAARAHLSHSRWADAWRVLWGGSTISPVA